MDSAADILERWRSRGGSPAEAIAAARAQHRGLEALVDDDEGWARLVRIARRTIDPWFVTDWPETFDPLVAVVPICHAVDWECASCPIGRQQHGQTCANPDSPISRVGAAIARDDRRRATTELEVFGSMLRHARTGDAEDL